VKITLKWGEIDKAVKQLEEYKKTLPSKIEKLVKRLVDSGVDIAKAQIRLLDAVDTAELVNSIDGMMYVKGNKGVVFTDCPYAAFVEFGTGVVGKNNPHPTLPWAYDINNHGEGGWFYPTDESDPNPHKHLYNGQWWGWTKGMPSRPFMYNTSVELRNKLEAIAKEVFADD